MSDFTHIEAESSMPIMVDVGEKAITNRRAKALGSVWLPKAIRERFSDNDIQTKKGAVFQTAIIAGTMGLKQTAQLIPFCHQIKIEGSHIEIHIEDEHAIITCTVNTMGKTGVEMEALVGVQIAALTIYDMCKSIDNTMRIEKSYLVYKRGGKSDHDK